MSTLLTVAGRACARSWMLALPAAVLLAGAPAAWGQSDQQPASKPAAKEPASTPTNGDEILRKLREEAEKAGYHVDEPAASPKKPPAAVPPPRTPAPAAPTRPAPMPHAAPANKPAMPPAGVTEPGKVPGAPAIAAPEAGSTDDGSSMIRMEFHDAVEVEQIVKFVQDELGLQIIATDNGLAGQKILFTQPLIIPRSRLLDFLVMVLDTKEYTIVQDKLGLFVIQPKNQISSIIGTGAYATTKVIHTPNIKPSALQAAINQILNTNRVGGAPAQPVFMDDLGAILLTDTPHNISLVEDLVNRLVKERGEVKLTRFELNNISASAARERVLELVGQPAQEGRRVVVPGQPAPAIAAAGAVPGALSNLNERLIIDSSSNALFFRGRPDETEQLKNLLALVDVPNAMVSKWYPVGLSTAEAVASAGKREQLGDVTTFQSSAGTSTSGRGRVGVVVQPGVVPGQTNQQEEFTGSGFVIYPESNGFMYRGTPAQQERVAALVSQLKGISEQDLVTIEFYKLKHAKSTDVATVIQNLLTNSTGAGNTGTGLVGRNIAGPNRGPSFVPPASSRNPNRPGEAGGVAGGTAGGLGDISGEDVFVTADEQNNQVVVKAPAKLQREFKDLIAKIDLRRPQVYIDTKIVAVTYSHQFALNVEVQQIIGQFALNTNFGLGTLTQSVTSGTGSTATTSTTGGLQSPKTVATDNSGITAALIRSKDVPFVINALATNTDSRIVASPQLLVDDNQEAEVSSLDEQPTATTTISTGNPNQTSFGGYESAGPKFTVTPQIAEGGYLNLKYNIELSSFTGAGTDTLPAPKQTNTIKSDSVTVPSDTTIVVGGLTFDTDTKTVLKIPLIGDIPILGNLFRDTSTNHRRTTLYVFITPKIMRDPSFADLRLITKAPLAQVDLYSEMPPAEPVRVDILDAAKDDTAQKEKKREEENRRRFNSEPTTPIKNPRPAPPVD